MIDNFKHLIICSFNLQQARESNFPSLQHAYSFIDNQQIAKGIMVTCRERVVASKVGMDRLQEWVW